MTPEPALPLTGSCGCGAVRFELSERPVGALYCHCTRCQRRSGTAAPASARIAPGSFSLLAGEQHLREWSPPEGLAKVFCSDCGSALFARQPGGGEVVGVRMGAFDSDPGVRPSFHQFVAYAAPWEPLPEDGLPRFEERRPA